MTQKALKVANLIDKKGNWIGGETVVVQVGDPALLKVRLEVTGIDLFFKEKLNKNRQIVSVCGDCVD